MYAIWDEKDQQYVGDVTDKGYDFIYIFEYDNQANEYIKDNYINIEDFEIHKVKLLEENR